MGKLIVSDLKKLVKCRTVWVCAVISFLVGMLMTFLYDMAWNNMTDTQNYQTVFYFMRTMGMDSDMTKQVLSQFPSQVFWQYVNTLCFRRKYSNICGYRDKCLYRLGVQ